MIGALQHRHLPRSDGQQQAAARGNRNGNGGIYPRAHSNTEGPNKRLPAPG